MKKIIDVLMKKIFLISAIISSLVIVVIGYFVFEKGLPVFMEYGFREVIFGKAWHPSEYVYGIYPMIIGTFYVTIVALIIGVPTGLATAVFLAELAGERVTKIIRPAIELLAGIPSVIYGLFGMVVVNQIIRDIQRGPLNKLLPDDYKWGFSVLSGGIVLAIMILPTIINISEDAIRAVPYKYKEGSLGIGATHFQTIFKVIIPAAKSGIISAIILAMGRALGETMALIMVIGNVALVPDSLIYSIFAPMSTLTGTIALEMGYAGPDHKAALFAIAIVLFVIIGLLNALGLLLTRKGVKGL